jgi:hypothetical protein
MSHRWPRLDCLTTASLVPETQSWLPTLRNWERSGEVCWLCWRAFPAVVTAAPFVSIATRRDEKPHPHARSRTLSTTPSYRSRIDLPYSPHIVPHWRCLLVDMLVPRYFLFFAALLTLLVTALPATAEPPFPPCVG